MNPSVKAMTVLAQVMTIYNNREIGDLEASLWTNIISEYGDAAVISFLIEHSANSVYAPKPADARILLAPGKNNSTAAFEELLRAISGFGPYMNPVFKDKAIAGAVVLLGGWVKVNEQMPDPFESKYEFDAYFKRFDVLYRQSISNLIMGQGYNRPLLGLHSFKQSAVPLIELKNKQDQLEM